MHIIRTDYASPPPLVMALQTLANISNPPHHRPAVYNWRGTSLVDLGNIDPALRSLNADQTTSLLATLGQTLWRYVPTMAEAIAPEALTAMGSMLLLDRNKVKYLGDHNLPVMLDGTTRYGQVRHVVHDAAMLAGAKGANMARFQRHRNSRTRIVGGDAWHLSDYTVASNDQPYVVTPQACIPLNLVEVMNDPSFKPKANARSEALAAIKLLVGDTRRVNRIISNPTIIDQPPTVMKAAPLLARLKTSVEHRRIYRPCRCKQDYFTGDKSLTTGVFFSTPKIEARLEHMGDGEYGQVDLSDKPFKITLNSNVAYPRVQLSLVHELMHLFDELHKINLTHEQVHQLALIVFDEVLPALNGLAESQGKQLVNNNE